MAKELDEILTHIDKLNELDTTAVEPMAQVAVRGRRDRYLAGGCRASLAWYRGGFEERSASGSRLLKVPLCDRTVAPMNISKLTIGEIRRGLLEGEFSAVEVAQETLRFAEAENPKTNALLTLSHDRRFKRRSVSMRRSPPATNLGFSLAFP